MPSRRTRLLMFALLGTLILGALYWVLTGGMMTSQRKPLKIGQPAGGRVEKSDAEWKAILSPEVYRITRQSGTERSCSGAYWNNHEEGEYHCACCGQLLFRSDTKFDSGTGWPSFFQPVDENALSLYEDRSHFMIRVEVTCSRCDAHLGHVFEDGPRPTGLRYCMNSGAMVFTANSKK